jgi:hypothetical protein
MLDGFVQALPQLGVGGLLIAVFALLVYRGPLYMGQRNEARRHETDAGAVLTSGLVNRVTALEDRLERAEAEIEKCHRERDESRAEVMGLKAIMEAWGKVDQEVQIRLSAGRQADAEAAKKAKPDG